MSSPSPRFLFYSHNGVGVGHFRRQLRLAAALRDRRPEAAILLMTGSHAASTLSRPLGFDVISLPSIRMVDRYQTWEPRQPGLRIKEVIRMRTDLLRRTVRRFRPDLLIADFMPAGPYGELEPALRELAACGGQALAGFRDIVDAPEFVRELWADTGVYDVLREHYAAICVYGTPQVVDFEQAYGLGGELASRLHYAGYLIETQVAPAEPAGQGRPTVLACSGGGVDGGALLECFIGASRGVADELGAPLVVGGPLLSDRELARLQDLAAGTSIEVRRFVAGLDRLIASSHLVVTMPGYNTTCELLASPARAIVVPRAGPSQEQRMRAAWLESWKRARVLDPSRLEPDRLADEIRRALRDPAPPSPPVPVDGLTNATGLIEALALGAGKELLA